MRDFTIRNVNVLDRSGGFAEATDVAVVDGKVAAIGRSLSPAGADDVDGAGQWLIPGIFDCHTHVTFACEQMEEALQMPVSEWALEAGAHLASMLRAGVTTTRDAGGADQGLKNALRRRLIDGPDLHTSVVVMSQTGGHLDGYLQGPGLEMTSNYFIPYLPGRPSAPVDGLDEMRKTVRQTLRAGADWIKLCTTGGVMSPSDDPYAPELTRDEIATAVFEARRRGKHVMAHAFGGEGLTNAVVCGARSIEHGYFLDEEQAAMMVERDCFLVPTLAISADVIRRADEGALPGYAIPKARELRAHWGKAVRLAHEHGVKLAVGTDFIFRSQHGRNREELALFQEAGLTAEEALIAATANGAELLGVADRQGRIEVGYEFDAILLGVDPSDLSRLRDDAAVRVVFKGGRCIVDRDERWSQRPKVDTRFAGDGHGAGRERRRVVVDAPPAR